MLYLVMNRLILLKNATLLIVEGEKCKLAAADLAYDKWLQSFSQRSDKAKTEMELAAQAHGASIKNQLDLLSNPEFAAGFANGDDGLCFAQSL